MPTVHEATDAAIRLRAWGTDDPRVIPAISWENTPSRTQRRKAIGRRAAAAGWPEPKNTLNQQRAAAKVAYRRRRRTTARLPEEPTDG